MSHLSTIELCKEDMKFSVGHFTIFSQTERENLHGHNYALDVAFTTVIEKNGLSFDYRFYKSKLIELCNQIDISVLIPTESTYLKIVEQDDYYHIHYGKEVLIFLKRDVKLLPIVNITVEELSRWFLLQIIENPEQLDQNKILAITVKIYSGPGQCGSSMWEKSRGILNQSSFK